MEFKPDIDDREIMMAVVECLLTDSTRVSTF